MRRFMKFLILMAFLTLICFSGIGSGYSGTIYSESFNTGSSLRDLGFTFFGRESDGWKLNTASGCLESYPVKGHQMTGLYSPTFEANRTEGTVGLEWTINFQNSRPERSNQKDGHHGQPNGFHHGSRRQDWVRIGLIGDKGWLGYSLKFKPQQKQGKLVALRAELEKSGKQLKSSSNLNFSQGDRLQFRIELAQPTPDNDKVKSKGKGRDKDIIKISEVKVYYGVNGSGFREWFSVKEKTPYTRFAKVCLDHEIDDYSDLQVKIDDLKVTGYVRDQTAPVSSHDYLFDGQWVKTPVTISFIATDQGGGAAQIYYRLNNGEPVTGNQIQFAIDGIYTVEYWAVDQAGNKEVPKSLTIKLDQVLPTISSGLTPMPNNNGWNNSDLTVTFTGTDALSGIASVTEPLQVTTEGVGQVYKGQAIDLAGNTAETSVTVNLDKTAPVISNLQPASGAQLNQKRPVISAGVFDELSGIDPASIQLTLDGQLVNGTYDSNTKIISYIPGANLNSGAHSVTLYASDMASNPVTTGSSFMIVTSDPNLPPDPAEVAPALDPTIVSDMKTATSFLYTGENPIQTGVDPETIEPRRAAVIRGKVLDKDGQPLPGVKMSILDHTEFGATKSRADGMFDLAVNGGGYLTVKYEKDGYLSAQRQVNVPWQDYVWTQDVILLQKDPNVTNIALGSDQVQVARGSVITDDDGIRQATLIIPEGTQVPGYSGSSLNIRATEFTVGSNGPKAMPAQLPANVGYTYCIDLSADEMDNVQFSQPIYFYLENFLNFPVGGNVPTGYYDEAKGAWIPSDNGVIIQILSVTDGLAEVDVAGSGTAADEDTLASLGFTDTERQKLAETYMVGRSLWRVPITNFSSWDCNWGWGPPADAVTPNGEPPSGNENCPDPNLCYIERETQVVRESTAISGTPFILNYSSDRVPGRLTNNTLQIPLSGNAVPNSLKRIDLEINIAGQQYSRSFSNASNQETHYTWNGKNGYDQTAPGIKQATIKVGYVYDGSYQTTKKFGYNGNGLLISGSRAAFEVTLWKTYKLDLGTCPDGSKAINGWSLNVHHFYDSIGKTLYLGDGSKRKAENIATVITTVAGTGVAGYSGDGGPAIEASFRNNWSKSIMGPDGSIYITDNDNHRIRKIDQNGIVTTIAGTGQAGYSGDGGLAINARINQPEGVALGPDGTLYIADTDNNRIRAVSIDGIIRTVAGTGSASFSGDGGLATQASLNNPTSVFVSPDGSLYICDCFNSRIRKVSTDGIITTIAGNGSQGYGGDNGPATQARLNHPWGIIMTNDGTLYFAETQNHRIRRIDTNGIITTVAGNGIPGYSGDGGLATQASLNNPFTVAVQQDGTIFIADVGNNRIRVVNPKGIISTVVGNGTNGFGGDNGPALQASLRNPRGIFMNPDGSLLISDSGNNRIRQVHFVLPGFSESEIAIPSEGGNEIYKFDSAGRHLSTLNTLTGTTIYSFEYDSNGLLIKVTDQDGNITVIERDGSGNPTAIIAPFGQRTYLTIDSDGYLSTLTNPANETRSYTYFDGGLLATISDPKGYQHQFNYDSLGRGIRQLNPDGGSITLERSRAGLNYQVKVTDKQDQTNNYVTTYSVEKLSTGATRRVTAQNGINLKETIIGTDESETTTFTDGTVMTITKGPDARFGIYGMQAPIITEVTITTPGGLEYKMTGSRTAVLSDPNNPLSVTQITDTTIINGKTYTTVYDATARTFTSTTPMGRQTVTTLDEKGRVVKVAVPGLAPVVFEYDERGRLFRTTEGSGSEARVSEVSYADNGLVDYVTDPLGRQTRFEYDPVGRVTRQILPGGKQISFSYDPNGNLIGLTPPGRPEHGFGYNAVDLNDTYNPPEVGTGATQTEYGYNLAKQPTIVTRPDGKTIGFKYDTNGRLQELLIPEGEVTYAYHATTGNLTNIMASDSTMSYTYDGSLLKKAAWTGVIGGNVSVTYNNDLMVTSQSVNDGDSVSYGYDNDGLLVSAGSLTISRDTQNGMMTGSTIGSVSDSVTYNSFGELQRYQAGFGGSMVYSVDYGTRDKLGRIVTKTETVNGETHTYSYVYDPNTDELTDVYKDGALVSHYDYDANGNRVRYTGTNGTFNGTYDDQDRMLSYGGNTYQYTANGELARKTNTEGTTVYDYDVLGNLRAVTLPDGTRIEYLIDGLNRRIGKKVNGVLTQRFLYSSQLTPVAELDANGNVVARFVYATGINVPDYVVKGGVTYRVVSDHLGSPRVIINVAIGEIVQRMEYDEFGNVTLDTNPGFQPFGFAGGLYDKDTGLVRFGARDYDAESGRWTAKDPIGFLGGDTNHYGYVFNDPINLIDKTGYHAKWPSYIPFFGWGWTLGEGLYHAFGGQDGDCHDWNEWSNRMMMSTYITVTAGQILVNSGYTGGETIGGSGGGVPSNYPKPPGWNKDWQWRYPEGDGPSAPRWFDPNGGEWRWHAPDKWHDMGHWDYNPWTGWNSPWENIYH